MKSKILIVIKNLDGGTGTFLSQILKLKDFDFRVCVLERPRYGKVKIRNGYFFSKKPSHLASYGLNPLLYLRVPREFFWLQDITRREKPRLLLSIDTHSNLLACLIKVQSQDQKVIITTHNNVSAVVERKISKLLRPVLKFVGKYLFNKANRVVCVSSGVGKDFRKFFSVKKKIEIIHYGLDLTQVKKLESKSTPKSDYKILNDGKLKVISVGRFEEQKDFMTLIKTFKEVDEKKELDLILIGDGGQKSMLQSLVREQGIEKSVYFLGWRDNIFPYLAASDLFVLSSNYEGFGYVLLEAMSQGLPIISTDSPFGPREVLDNGKHGKLVPVGDENKMSKAILSLINDKEEYNKYSKRSIERVRFYSEKKMLNKYRGLIQKTIDNTLEK